MLLVHAETNVIPLYFYSNWLMLLHKSFLQCLQKEGFLGLEEITKNLPGGVFSDVKLRTPGKGNNFQTLSTQIGLNVFM